MQWFYLCVENDSMLTEKEASNMSLAVRGQAPTVWFLLPTREIWSVLNDFSHISLPIFNIADSIYSGW